MPKAARAPKGVRLPKSLRVEDVRKTAAWTEAMISLCEREPEILERAGIDPAVLDELRSARQGLHEIEVPTARAMALAALTNGLSKDVALHAYHRSILALHALAPIVVMRLAEKLDDHQSPGSTRVMLELAKGIGILVPAEPIDARNRAELLKEAELRERSTESLTQELLDGL